MLRHAILGLLAVLALAANAAAAEPDRCDVVAASAEIPGFTPAQVEEKPAPKYPKKSLKDATEGWVLLEYAVTAEGKVKDAVAIDAIGPSYFVAAAFDAAESWRYKPAMRGGAAVEQLLYRTSVLFHFENSGRSTAHADFVRKYNRARTLMADGDTDTALELLEQAFKGRLNLYEAAMGSFALALAHAQKKDWPRALAFVRHAVISERQYLIDEARVPALAAQVDFEAKTGNYTEALCAFEKLRAIDAASAKGESPAAKTAAQIKAALAAKTPLSIEATLGPHPLLEGPAIWRHRMLRAKFSFAEIKGNVASFALVCVAGRIAAAVTPNTTWSLPENAGPCVLRVEGDPGAGFKLIETW